MADAFLLGNLRDAPAGADGPGHRRRRRGDVVYNIPGHSGGQLVFIPLVFAIGWCGGPGPREPPGRRGGGATCRPGRGGAGDRARIAAAEERARIARELHDIVAHAVSVMVLQVGAVRHKLPDALAEDRDALRGVEQAGRAALTEMRRLLDAMRDGEGTTPTRAAAGARPS